MKLREGNLKIRMHGEDVTLLHDELKTLGFSIPDKEIADGVFGQGTEQAVKEFQEKHGLQMSGIVDQETAAQINREEQGPGPDSDKSFVVKGRVVYADGKPLADGLVRAFDKDLRSEEFLGEITTDGEGRYAIHYNAEQFSRAEQGSADLIVRAYNPDGLELASSQIVFNAQPEETIDLVVGNEVYRGPSEYDQLVKQLTPLLQGLTFAELTEDEEHQDVTFLSGETGEKPLYITFLITARRLAERTDIAPEIFYGLLRNDLPPNLSALLVQDPELVRRSLEMAAADNIIPARFAEEIDNLLARFRQLVVSEAVRPVGDGEEQGPLVTLLGTVLSDREQKAVFVERYIDHTGPIDEFWQELRAVPELANQVDALQFGLQAGALTGNHLPLVRKLQRMREEGEEVDRSTHRIETFRDLVYVDENKWQEIIQRPEGDGTIGVPKGTPGEGEEQIKQYARTLTRIVERSFPTAFVAARLADDDLDGKEQMLTFLQRNVNSFEINGARLETYLAEHPGVMADIPEHDRPQLKQRLRAMQRVYRVAPRYGAMSALLKDGIDSAYAITNIGRNLFALIYGHNPALDNQATAYRVYERAEQVHAFSLAIASDHGMATKRVPMNAVTDERASSDSSIPDWETLFGSLELCDCEHCRSVYSPAAYLVDLLHFLQGRRLIDPDSIKRDDKSGRITKSTFLPSKTDPGKDLTAKEVLFQRRADLGEIELTCANTNTPLPYVDLVNETLEDFIAEPPDFSSFDLTSTLADDLDQSKVSKSIRDAFNKKFRTQSYLCENATIEVEEAGKHWCLHDCAYSYDIRIDKGKLSVKTRGRQTISLRQELAANPQYLNPEAYEKLEEHVFPLTLPFDLWDEEARTYLDHLGVKRYRLMEAFRDGTRAKLLADHAISRAHLGLTSRDAKLITGATTSQAGADTPGVWNLWGFEKASGSTIPDPANSTGWIGAGKGWLEVLTGRVDVFLQQSGLTYKEMLELLGIYFVNPLMLRGDRPISLTARPEEPDDTCETNGLCLIGMDENAALRALRFIRLWRKLGWSMQNLDRALTVLGVNTPLQHQPTIALGATGAAPIDDPVLTQLSHIQRLHEQLGVSVERLLPFWGKIDSARYIDHDAPGQPPFATLYERLFRNKGVINPPDAAFTQDPSQLKDKLSEYTTTISAALGVSAADLDLLLSDPDVLSQVGPPSKFDTLSLENLSVLYCHATLANALDLSVRDYLIALKLAFNPFAKTMDTVDTVLFVEQIQALAASDLTLVELDYLTRHQILESDRAAPTEEEIARILTALRSELRRIAAENRFEEDSSAPGGPTVDLNGDLTSRKLALLGWEGSFIDQVIATFNDTVTYRVKLTGLSKKVVKDITKLNDPGTYEVPLSSLPPNVIPTNLAQVVTHAKGMLKASRRLIPSERSTLLDAVKSLPPVKSAVQKLIDQQDAYLGKVSYDEPSQELCFTGVMSKARRDMLLSSSMPANAAFKDAVKKLYQAPRTFLERNLRSYQIERFSTPLAELPKKPKSGTQETISFSAVLRDRIFFHVEKGHGAKKGYLYFVGAMTEEERDALLKLSTDKNYRNAIEALYKAPPSYKQPVKDVFLIAADSANLFDKPKIPAERFEYLLKELLPYLHRSLSERAVVPFLAEALDLETQTVSDLLTKWLEWPAKVETYLFSWDDIPGNDNKIFIEFLKKKFGIDGVKTTKIEKIDDGKTIRVSFKNNLLALKLNDEKTNVSLTINDVRTDKFNVKQKDGKLNIYAGTRLLETFLDKPFAESNPLVTVTNKAFQDQFDAYILMHKSALVLLCFECTPRQARWLFTYASAAKWPDLNALPVTETTKPAMTLESWLRLVELFDVRDGMPRGEEMLDDLLARGAAVSTSATTAEKNKAKAAYLKALVKWTQWSVKELDTLLGDKDKSTDLGQLKLAFPSNYTGATLLARMRDCFTHLDHTGLSAANCVKLVAEDVQQDAARAIKEAVRGKYDEAQWLNIAPPLRDALRERQRAALVTYLVASPDKKHGWRKVSDIYGWFLLDVEMSPCQMTSRIKQAISSVQLFVQRCLMGLEPQVLATAEVDNRWREWRWMKNYRVWEANRKIFLYPENWIEPELRDDKTSFFKALEGELLQTNLTKDTAAAAFRGYLDKLDAVARLEVVGMYHQREKDSSEQVVVDHLHVFGRTAGTPHQYYYRRRVDDCYWTPWERVDLDIGAGTSANTGEKKEKGLNKLVDKLFPDHLIPVVWRARLFLIWPIFTDEPKPQTSEPTGPIPKRWKIQLAWSEYKDGKWLPKKISAAAYKHDFLKPNLEKERFIFKAFSTKAADSSSSRLVIEAYVLTAFCRTNVKDPENFNVDYNRLVRFTIDECSGDFAIKVYGPKGIIARPNEMGPRSMMLCPCSASNGKLYLPTGIEDYENAEALAKTPRGDFRLLYAHQRSGFSGLRSESWFFNTDPRTYWVVPKWRLAVMMLKKPDPAINEMLGAAQASGLALHATEDDPFAAVVSAALLGPMINPGDPLLFDDSMPELAAVETNAVVDVSTGELNIRAADSLPVPATGPLGAASDASIRDSIPLAKVGTYLAEESSTSPVGHFVLSLSNYSYRFYPFYHPYICRFIEALNLNGVDGLLQRPLQLLSDEKLHKRNLFTFDYKPNAGTTVLIDWRYPVEEVDFSLEGAYSQYNWELFFHAPLLIADSLRRNQRFEDAQRWFHYIFDPTDSSGLPVPDRYWRTKPFYLKTSKDYQRQQISFLLRLLASGGDISKLKGISGFDKEELQKDYKDLVDAVLAWCKDPFKPHLVARMRTTAYQKTVVMKYLDNLIDWGDQLFRRDTMESINEATQLYILAADILGKRPEEVPPRAVPEVHTYDSIEPLLGKFSNALVQIEEIVPPSALSSGGGQSQQPLPSLPTMLYFCVPKNDELLAYWDKVADRLFKIRHCMSIEGVVRQLPLFAPPINPALLVKAAAAGLDIGSVLAEVNAPLPHYRFQVLSQKATELCSELKSLGAALLVTLEKRDAEKLALLHAEQATALLELAEDVRKKQVEEAKQQIEVLEASREIASARYSHFQELLTAETLELPSAPAGSDDTAQVIGFEPASGNACTQEGEGVRMISQEVSELENMKSAKEWQEDANYTELAANVAHALPDFLFKLVWKDIKFGGSHVGHAISAFASGFKAAANMSSAEASQSSRMASFVMRAHDWVLQTESAAKEITHIDQQIIAAHIRKEIAEQELSNHKKQIEQAEKLEKTLRDKYTNEELYTWMIGQVSGVYFQSYQLAYDLAKRAERAFRHELGLSDSDYIRFGYWDSLKKGLLAGERLTHDLKRMEVAYLDRNRRELEITKHVSLLQLDPVALIELRENSKCFFDIPEALFDLDYPGHYMRRIKSVGLTIPCITGPYTGVNCTLTLVRSSIRHSNTLSGGDYSRDLENDDSRFTDSIGAAQSIVTSSGQADSGLFETNLRDERYLPFEGAGVIGTWRLEMPGEFKPFDYDTITDVVLHTRYTARAAGGLLEKQAVSELKTAVNAIAKAGDKQGLARVFSLRHEYPSEWRSFVTLPKGAVVGNYQQCTFDVSKERFPFLFQGRTIKVGKVEVFVDLKVASDGSKSQSAPKLALKAGETALDPCTSTDPSEEKGLWRVELKAPTQLGKWTLSACLDAKQADALEDILIVCHYKIE